MSPKYQKHYWSSSGQKPFKTFSTGRLGTVTFHWHTLFERNPIHLQLHHPLLLASLIQSSMDLSSLSSLHEHHTPMLYFVITILISITSLRKQLRALHMPPLSSPSNEPRTEEETSGKPRLRNKSSCCIPKYEKARATSHLSTSSPNIAMHMYQCQHVLNMSNINYQMNIHANGFLLDAIQCADAGLQAAMASIKTDNGPDGMWNDFELAVAHLLPYNPVAKK